jgi:hypothetical protein
VGWAATARAVPPEAITPWTGRAPNAQCDGDVDDGGDGQPRVIAGVVDAGSRRSFAVKVMMPKPRKAKRVRATLATMSHSGGYPDGARSATK